MYMTHRICLLQQPPICLLLVLIILLTIIVRINFIDPLIVFLCLIQCICVLLECLWIDSFSQSYCCISILLITEQYWTVHAILHSYEPPVWIAYHQLKCLLSNKLCCLTWYTKFDYKGDSFILWLFIQILSSHLNMAFDI